MNNEMGGAFSTLLGIREVRPGISGEK